MQSKEQEEVKTQKKYFTETERFYEDFSKSFEESFEKGTVLTDIRKANHVDVFMNRYQLAMSSDGIEKMRYQISVQMINDLFKDWLDKSKNESQKNIIKKCQDAMIEIFVYNFTLEKNIKYAIAEKLTVDDMLSLYQQKAYEQKKEIDALKKEIEFISK